MRADSFCLLFDLDVILLLFLFNFTRSDLRDAISFTCVKIIALNESYSAIFVSTWLAYTADYKRSDVKDEQNDGANNPDKSCLIIRCIPFKVCWRLSFAKLDHEHLCHNRDYNSMEWAHFFHADIFKLIYIKKILSEVVL